MEDQKKQTIMLCGGAGFIGQHLALKYLNLNYSVHVLDLKGKDCCPYYTTNNNTEDATWHICDIMDQESVLQILEKVNPKIIVHLACLPTVNEVNNNPILGFHSILTGTRNILESIIDLNINCKLVYISSSMVYGNFLLEKVSEDHPTNPINRYGCYKLMAELMIRNYGLNFGLKYNIVRPSAVYGPGMTNLKAVLPHFIHSAIKKETLCVHGDGSLKMDFTNIFDLVNGIVLTSTNGKDGETYNVTYGNGRSVHDLIKIIANLVGTPSIKYVEMPKSMPKRGTLDISKIQRDLHYTPLISLEKGTELYLKYIYNI